MRFDHALQSARGIGAGTTSAYFRAYAVRDLESARWKLWHGCSSACLGRLAKLANWHDCGHARDVRNAVATRRHVSDLIEYLHANRHALVNYGQRRHDGLPISTTFVESTVNDILSKRMIKKQQVRWNPMDGAAFPRRVHSRAQPNARPFVQAAISSLLGRQ
jgi:hypothetical protein